LKYEKIEYFIDLKYQDKMSDQVEIEKRRVILNVGGKHFEPKQPKYPLLGTRFVDILPDGKTMRANIDGGCCDTRCTVCIVDIDLMKEEFEWSILPIKWSYPAPFKIVNDDINAAVGISFKDDPDLIGEYGTSNGFCFDLKDNSLWSCPPYKVKYTDLPKIQFGDKITCIFSPTVGTLTFKVNDIPISDTPSFTDIPLDRPLCPYILIYNDFSCEFDFPVC
jgi:hypothetical protein